ncbi:hypothetical protein OnM2_023046 [Erysiphe neolycopersici]|uniref:DUF7905 domain-containing protein n=1 Tax=Erysiphe neolycopersici TaxID=212602 RepID=A0A420I248_9PEZI|nr:hypothetical protein OnM2_023046 [Erysiphe neolycopersici]
MISSDFFTPPPDRDTQKVSMENAISVAEHHLFFASEYYLKPKGLDYIRREFKYQLNQLEVEESLVKFKYDLENSNFHITCTPGKSNVIWKIFHAILTGMVREECQKSARLYNRDSLDSSDEDSSNDDEYECYDEDLVLESDKIGRMDMYKAQVQKTVPLPTCISPLNNIHIQDDNQSFNYIYDWDVEALNINYIFSDSILQELSSLTGCIFNKDSSENRIYVRSSLEACLNSGISKMNNIKNYFLSEKKKEYHFFYSELETNIQFSFLRLKNSKNRMFKTTLIDSFVSKNGTDKTKELRDSIQNAVIMRCASFDRVSATFRIRWKLKVVPVVKEEDRNLLERNLRKPVFASRGLLGETYELLNVNQSKTRNSASIRKHNDTAETNKKLILNVKTPLISNWVQDVVESGSIKAQVRGSELAVTKSKVPPNGSRSYDVHGSDQSKDISLPIIHGLSQNEMALKKLRSSLTSPIHAIGKIPATPKSYLEQKNSRKFWSLYPGRSSSITKNRKTLPTLVYNLMDDCPADFSCDILKPKKQSSSTSVEVDVSQSEEILPHYSLSSSQQSISKSKKKKKQKKKSNPLQMELPLPSPTHKKNESTVHDNSPLIWGNHILESFQQNLNLTFESIMKNLQAFRGELSVEAQFGRIITHGIKDMYVSKKGECERTYNEESARRILNEPEINMISSNFTRIITTIPAEIQYIIDMKDSHGFKCWLQEKNDLSSYYELYFRDKKFYRIIKCRIKTTSEFGIVNVHGTTKLWDFRISATGINSEDRLKIQHDELVEMICSSLFIPYDQQEIPARGILENCTLPSITFQINESLNNRYHLEKAITRHIHKYLSRDNQSILKISEVQSLTIKPRNSHGKKMIIQAFYPDDLNVISSHILRLWYEISISSVSLNNELTKNQNLELGELAQWSFEGTGLSSIAYSIYSPACWLLERLDGIGSFNDNGLDIQESSPVTSDIKPAALQFYW